MPNETIDWSGCSLVEVNPRVQSGAPVLRNTRMPVEGIVANFDHGVRAILAYAKEHRLAHPFR